MAFNPLVLLYIIHWCKKTGLFLYLHSEKAVGARHKPNETAAWKPQTLVPTGNFGQLEAQKFVPANLKKSQIRKIKVPQKFHATR